MRHKYRIYSECIRNPRKLSVSIENIKMKIRLNIFTRLKYTSNEEMHEGKGCLFSDHVFPHDVIIFYSQRIHGDTEMWLSRLFAKNCGVYLDFKVFPFRAFNVKIAENSARRENSIPPIRRIPVLGTRELAYQVINDCGRLTKFAENDVAMSPNGGDRSK